MTFPLFSKMLGHVETFSTRHPTFVPHLPEIRWMLVKRMSGKRQNI